MMNLFNAVSNRAKRRKVGDPFDDSTEQGPQVNI